MDRSTVVEITELYYTKGITYDTIDKYVHFIMAHCQGSANKCLDATDAIIYSDLFNLLINYMRKKYELVLIIKDNRVIKVF